MVGPSSAPRALVVGGTRGSGRAIALRLARDGYDVTVLARRPADLPGIRCIAVDVADPRARGETLDDVAAGGSLASLVFVQRFRGTGDAWAGELAVSLEATRATIDRLVEEVAGGSIVIVSSNASRFVAPEQGPAYHAVKAALRQLARWYAVELGPRGTRVNCVSPGTVLKEESRGDPFTQSLDDLYGRVTPLRRMGLPEDVAGVVAFLCGGDASFVTGQDVTVDGGLSLLWQESLARETAGLGTDRPRR